MKKVQVTKPRIFRNEHKWYCVLWPLIGRGDTAKAAWVDFELRCLLWERS
jgi:hypothetical protein